MQKSRTSANAYHPHCLLIHTKIKEKSSPLYCACLCAVPFSLLFTLLPQLPWLSVKAELEWRAGCRRWAPGFQAVSHTPLIGSYRSPENNKNTSFCLHHSHLSGFTCKQQLLFHYNDIILIGAATENLHLLISGIIIRQYCVVLIWVAKGKEQFDWTVGLLAFMVSGTSFIMVHSRVHMSASLVRNTLVKAETEDTLDQNSTSFLAKWCHQQIFLPLYAHLLFSKKCVTKYYVQRYFKFIQLSSLPVKNTQQRSKRERSLNTSDTKYDRLAIIWCIRNNQLVFRVKSCEQLLQETQIVCKSVHSHKHILRLS